MEALARRARRTSAVVRRCSTSTTSRDTRIELSVTHPGGLPQFITGKTVLLSSLIRDELALRNARLAAGAITQKGIELRSMRGIESVHLGIGLAQWTSDDDRVPRARSCCGLSPSVATVATSS